MVREEFMEFATEGFVGLDKDSPLYQDMEDILEREKDNKLKFHTHAEVWTPRLLWESKGTVAHIFEGD